MSSELLYEGSVKNLWSVSPREIEFEFTDAYSVFDWGRMPDLLQGKGEALAAMGAYFFEELAKTGLHTHFVNKQGANKLRVRKVEIERPQFHRLGNQVLADYQSHGKIRAPSRLIPLEVVFRFGMPKGSSLSERLTPQYSKQLGFKETPKEGALFAFPIVEFFTKLEDTDRFLTFEQALNYSGVEFAVFGALVNKTVEVANWLRERFQNAGLELWDGKLEWAMLDEKLALVDSIGPDELRLIEPKSGVQVSKEFLRQYYRKTKWFEVLQQEKKKTEQDASHDWYAETLKKAGEPPKLSKEFKEIADALYPALAQAVTGKAGATALKSVLERMARC